MDKNSAWMLETYSYHYKIMQSLNIFPFIKLYFKQILVGWWRIPVKSL